ncbi:MAG: Stp1/IreP family PP2C-type Ser/Thr phosphatase [Anaerolineae bacterium]
MPDQSRQPTPSRPNQNRGPTPSSPGAAPFTLRSVNLSDVGRARDHQEDASGIFKPSDPALLARRGELFIVADGMGGHNAGEVASQMALSELQRVYFSDASPDPQAALAQSLQAANQAIYQLSRADARQMGMGTTVAMAVVRNQEIFISNVGDSRVYLIRSGQISQVTRDHSWVEEQVRAGVLTPEQAHSHPQRNIITRALGTGPSVEPEFYTGAMQLGDILVLCSDGLTGHVADAEILLLAGENPPRVAAQRLIELANERGGSDNITALVVRAEPPGASVPGAAPVPGKGPVNRPSRPPYGLVGALVGVLAGVALIAYLLLKPGGTQGKITPMPTLTGTTSVVTSAAATISPTMLPSATGLNVAATVTTVASVEATPSPGVGTATLIPTPTITPTAVPFTPTKRPPAFTPTPTNTSPPESTDTPTTTPPRDPTNTPVPPTNTPVPPTATPRPPTATPRPPTNTPVPPTATPRPPTDTPEPPTDTPAPSVTPR